MNVNLTPTISRFEVIDETGRVYVAEGVSVEFSYQDAGRTLKAFVKAGEPVVREKGWLQKFFGREIAVQVSPAKRPSSKTEQG